MIEIYNFKPDYEKWWNKTDVTKDELGYVLLGINPNAIKYSQELAQKNKTTSEEQEFQMQFENFRFGLPQGMFIRDMYTALMRLDWNEGKHDFIYNAYEGAHDFPAEFCAYLQSIGQMPINSELESFKDHSQYCSDPSMWKPDDINSEDKALSLLLGLNSEFWLKFVILHKRQMIEPRTPDGLAAFYRFNPHDKWFFYQYNQFLSDAFPNIELGVPFRLIPPYEAAKDLSLWKGEFAEYVQELHNAGFIFREESYAALKKSGIIPEYTSNGWAVCFYRKWFDRGVLSLNEAAELYLGGDPFGGRELLNFGNARKIQEPGIVLHDKKTILPIDENGNMAEMPVERYKKETSLEVFVRKHIAAGNLIPALNNGLGEELYFTPKEIFRFFREKFTLNWFPEALFVALDLGDTKAQKNFFSRKNREEHKKYYKQYHGDQVSLYMNGTIEKPWQAHDKEEKIIRKKMGNGFDRKYFRMVRREILAQYPNSGKTRFSGSDYVALKSHISGQPQKV